MSLIRKGALDQLKEKDKDGVKPVLQPTHGMFHVPFELGESHA